MAQALMLQETNHPAMPAVAYLASLRTPASRAGMESELRKIARIVTGNAAADWRAFDWGTLTAANVAAILAKVDGAPASMNKTRAALRGIARAAWRLRRIDSEELARIDDIRPASGSRELTGRQVEGWELASLMRTCAADPTPSGARDAALFALAAKTGARREELMKVECSGMKRTQEGWEIRVIGKRSKERILYADDGAARALADWLAIRGEGPGALFCPINKSGVISLDRHMTTTAAHYILARRAVEAHLPRLSWHDLRRTFAGTLLDAGEDIATVAAMMGHSSVTTTARYDRRPAEARRKAARKISVPYFERARPVE